MRFAAPPLGDLRFSAPADPSKTTEIQDASSFGPICVGVSQIANASQGEDCLFINVWTPSNATSQSKLPVWLYIQGGGYALNANANYNGTEVVQQSGHGIVFVNFNYRVGALGFLASKEVRQDGALNAGLLDQRKVLAWVQENIALFGGDPEHVVIHGASAGAGSVALHLAAYGGRNDNLFVGAIPESTFWPTQRTVEEQQFLYDLFVNGTGCSTSKDTLSCLRSVDIDTIQAANIVYPFPGASDDPLPLWSFLPVIDGDLIRDQLYTAFETGRFIKVPLMVGDDANEGTIFANNASTSREVAQLMKNNYPKLTPPQLTEIMNAYPLMSPEPMHAPYFHSAAAAYGQATFTCPGNHMAASFAQYLSPDQVWDYHYDVLDPTEIALGLGVPHTFETPAIFGLGMTTAYPDALSYYGSNKPIIPIVMNYWISFVKTLNPNSFKDANAPEWDSWGSGTGMRLKIQTNHTDMEVVPANLLKNCEMWKRMAMTMEI
ncbi:hypothetical protein CFD26_101514 [Aspergillus turcosus]|uniref:Carboxylic ester hydrolase n=1 Tax=Aspergillus turcosus TaxID=1245748 RepID=A0A3R7J271_9EURO|nr:hypothetical protein CFD26_101514 [Aspergillus turcosus]